MCKNKVYLRSNRYYTNTKSIQLNCKWIQLTVSENSCNESNKKCDAKLKLNYLPCNINLWLNINQSLSLSDQLIYKTKNVFN